MTLRETDIGQNKRTVCIMTSVHNVFDIRIFSKEASTLARSGYNVILIAPGDNEMNESVQSIRLLLLKKPKNRVSRLLIFSWQILIAAKKQKADVYHFHDPELILVGLFLSALGNRVIYDAHEDLPKQIISKYWIPKRLRVIVAWLTKKLEAFSAKRFSAVITTSEDVAARFMRVNKQTTLLRNYPMKNELAQFSQGEATEITHDDSPSKIVTLGGVSPLRCIKEIIEAMGILAQDQCIKLIVAGACASPALLNDIKRLSGWSHVDYLGVLPRSEAISVLKESNVALVVYSFEPNHLEVKSNRLFESMAVGIPVITSNFPKWKQIVLGNKCGIVVDPSSPEDIAKAITTLIQHPEKSKQMGENGRQAVINVYNWESESKKLIALYEQVLRH